MASHCWGTCGGGGGGGWDVLFLDLGAGYVGVSSL